ncbi:hypothetical protein [Nocardia sp. NPDC003979]
MPAPVRPGSHAGPTPSTIDPRAVARRMVLGFAVVDRHPPYEFTAIWLTDRTTDDFVRNTNAVVIPHDDPDHDKKVRSLTWGRAVVLTEGTDPPLVFSHALRIEAFDDLIRQTADQQERICAAITDYSRRKRTKLVVPSFLPVPEIGTPERDEPQCRALWVADYIGAVWSAWLFTEEQRVRRTTSPKSRETPWIMPADLNSPTIADFPVDFAERVKPETVP